MIAPCSPSFRCFVVSLFLFNFILNARTWRCIFFHHEGPREESTFPRRFGTHPACWALTWFCSLFKDVDDDQTVVDALYYDTMCRDSFSCSRGGYRRVHRDAAEFTTEHPSVHTLSQRMCEWKEHRKIYGENSGTVQRNMLSNVELCCFWIWRSIRRGRRISSWGLSTSKQRIPWLQWILL